MRRVVSIFGAIVLGSVFSAQAFAITLRVQGANSLPGDTPDVCVYLDDNDGTVSGLQVDLLWDSSCLSIDRGTGDQGACVMNPETGRSTFQTRVMSDSRLRALMVSLNDTTPMPATVKEVFCCQFRVSSAAGGRTCGVNVANVVLSDRAGKRIQVTGVGGSITVARAGDQRGVPVGRSGAGGVMQPAMVGGSGGSQGAAGSAGGGAPALPAGGASGGAVGAPAVVAPGGSGPAPAVAPAQMPAGQGVVAPEEAGGGAAAEKTPEATEAPTKPAPAATTPAKAASPGKTPEAVGTPAPEGKKTPAQASPAASTPGSTPSPHNRKHDKSHGK